MCDRVVRGHEPAKAVKEDGAVPDAGCPVPALGGPDGSGVPGGLVVAVRADA